MTAREYLEQYKEACRRIRRYEQEYEEECILVDAVRSLSDNDGMPHSHSISRPTEDKAIRLADASLRLVTARLKAVELRQDIFDTVMSIGGLESEVLLQRFIYLRGWMDICRDLNYSWYPIRIAWHRGEEMIQKILDDRQSHTTPYKNI